MLITSAFFLHEFPPLRGLKPFFCIFLLFLHLSDEVRKMEKKQKDTKEDERRRREKAEVMSIKHSFRKKRCRTYSTHTPEY